MPAAKSFYHCCRYVCQDIRRAEVLKVEGVRGHDYRLMSADFESQRQLRPQKHQAVFHSVLSFYPGEKLENAKMVEIAEKYLQQIGMDHTQYVIAKHIDKNHLHLHLIANRVDCDGKSIRENWQGLRAKKVSQNLTQEFRLVQVLKKNLALTHLEALNESEARRYQVYQSISQELPKCDSWEELEKRLLIRGIDTRFRYDSETRERQGVSFRINKECFKGSQVDREFSCKNLERTLALRQKQILQQKLEREDLERQRQSQTRSHRMRHHF